MTGGNASTGSPYAPHTAEETMAMLDAVGVESVEALFDIPESVRFDGEFGIERRSEQATRRELQRILGKNRNLTEFLGRGQYSHYVPSLVDHIADRSEFLTSYTQYQPEVTQGFLQALFEYQSMLVELTGLEIANASMYDHATALAESALLASRVRQTSGNKVLVPDYLLSGRKSVLENYTEGPGLVVEEFGTDDGNVDVNALSESIDEDVVMVYAENPTTRGTIEENLTEIGDLAHDHDALFCLGSDPVALSLLQKPADVGADVVVGDAGTLGLPASYGMGLGLFATREEFVRQVPGRLVGVSEDEDENRAFTLTLQTREQHIRRERATSNICTNQAWVALRTAIHIAYLGSSGLVELAENCVTLADDLAEKLDDIRGVQAPVHDRHHFREFVAHTDQPAPPIVADLEERGFAVHEVGEHEVQVCVTDVNEHAVGEFVTLFQEVAR
ncbi:glycine dehydrogenase (decarboxylating) alpha subunit [Haladaptatus litoreus]|uniref:glycine dehydrogenase (aminomethyl-transferring) n=1 Tax=Haladaptatus litoreus TaxID=553468 RepID=A0A1N6ZBJ1_9EURY|nr:aminomethyl-transferring glycine dehydrogenase subunit GcvPA [Haladaptatus litoreus]SIR24184.1 glycine dehydrogenase (decarboxylating) alpha subunit [Haladaptatus litoreus]